MNLSLCLAVCALQNCGVCGVELWNLNGDSVDCWQLTDSLLADVVGDLLCLNIANIQQRCEKCVHIVSQSVAERYFLGM